MAKLGEVDYALFDKIMHMKDFSGMNMLEIAKHIYEVTFVTYHGEWIKEWEYHLEADKKIVAKNMKIEELESTIAMLKLKLSDYEEVSGVIDSGKQVPKEGNKEAEEYGEVLPFRKGGQEPARYTGHHRND